MKDVISSFTYSVPEYLIAQKPAYPRDSARLLVYSRKTHALSDSSFLHLVDHVPINSVLVFNETKVIPARLFAHKKTGGIVELLIISHGKNSIRIIANRKLKPGQILTMTKTINFSVEGKDSRFYILKPSFPMNQLIPFLYRYGRAPLPPYIKHPSWKESIRRSQYQSVFAKNQGSIAAPTASLHFTNRLLRKLKSNGVAIEFVTLHVGLGTFAPLSKENFISGSLHHEHYEISSRTASRLNQAKKKSRPIIAVGTTVVRTLESAAKKNNKVSKLSNETDLFIKPGYEFKFVDGMITNFHVPRSSLMMLVAAMISRKELFRAYRHALDEQYRFFSFGDGMLIV